MPQIVFPSIKPLPVVSQPKGNIGWVSKDGNAFTAFDQVRGMYGTDAFLAHNSGAGKYLYNLRLGDEIGIQHNMDETNKNLYFNHKKYKVKEIRRFQTLQPYNVLSPLIDLDTGEHRRAGDVTHEIYKNNKRVVFQTCIEKDNNPVWGRMFVIAE